MKVLSLILLIYCVKISLGAKETCSDFETCGACLGFPGDTCVWCSAPNTTVRCQSTDFHSKQPNWCTKNFVYNPKLESIIEKIDKPLQSANGADEAVQFRPQKMTVKLRPGQEIKIDMEFKHAKHFPLDVYYLMDYSHTMNSHVKVLKAQSEQVKKKLTEFTNNVNFGLGSFIEKPAYPFAGKEHSVYAFRNNLKITSNITLFGNSLVKKANFSNYDPPEAGLDALMQAMVCDKEVGWRPNANRIIVLCTDATYHSAGDGKMVLAYKPNDMQCHLNASGYYNYDLIQDYPSVNQISKIAKDGKFNIIFATTSGVSQTYSALAKHIGAVHSLLTASTPSQSNIFNIIQKAYLKSIRQVSMSYDFPPFVKLTLTPDCTRLESNECLLKHNESLKMTATLKVTSCPNDASDYHQVLHVMPNEGGVNDKLEINLEIVNCQCKCEIDDSGVKNSDKCNKLGTYQCGICVCNKDRSGKTCECDESKANSKIGLDECKNVNDTRFCSGRGKCRCQKCNCYEHYSGKYCEFDDRSCMKSGKLLCSGHGKCTLGACKCDSDWSKEDCSCSKLDHNCYAPYSKEKCSGNGKCICNQCMCDKIKNKEERYSGVFCEDCEDCAQKRCNELEEYARCNFLSNKTYCDFLYNHTFNTDVQMLNKSEINVSKWPTAKWCRTKLDEERSIVFLHMYDKKLLLIIQREPEQLPKADIWVPIGIAIGSVILIGLLTVLVWKLLVDAMDEREYNKFQKQAQGEGYDVSDNPLYQPASVNFSNPTYNQIQHS